MGPRPSGILAGLFLGRFPSWMRTHCAIATGVDTGLVDVLLTVVDERQLTNDGERLHGRLGTRGFRRARSSGSRAGDRGRDMAVPSTGHGGSPRAARTHRRHGTATDDRDVDQSDHHAGHLLPME